MVEKNVKHSMVKTQCVMKLGAMRMAKLSIMVKLIMGESNEK